VTAVLVLGGLPYDLCSAILAHEAFHAWISIHNDSPDLPKQVQACLCELIAYLWLCRRQEQQAAAAGGAGNLKSKGDWTSDADLRNFFFFQIETQNSTV